MNLILWEIEAAAAAAAAVVRLGLVVRGIAALFTVVVL